MRLPTETERLKEPAAPYLFFRAWNWALLAARAPLVGVRAPLTTKELVPDVVRAARTLEAKARAVPMSANATLAASLNVASPLTLFIGLFSATKLL